MTLYAKAPDDITDELTLEYITPGKLYKVVEEGFDYFEFIDDDGEQLTGRWKHCAHLADGNWQRVEKEDEDAGS